MNQLTVRGFEPQLANVLQRMVKEEHISLNQAALRLMRKGAGLTAKQPDNCIGDQLDHFIGDWSDEEANALEQSTADLRAIDDEMWR